MTHTDLQQMILHYISHHSNAIKVAATSLSLHKSKKIQRERLNNAKGTLLSIARFSLLSITSLFLYHFVSLFFYISLCFSFLSITLFFSPSFLSITLSLLSHSVSLCFSLLSHTDVRTPNGSLNVICTFAMRMRFHIALKSTLANRITSTFLTISFPK